MWLRNPLTPRLQKMSCKLKSNSKCSMFKGQHTMCHRNDSGCREATVTWTVNSMYRTTNSTCKRSYDRKLEDGAHGLRCLSPEHFGVNRR
eukprot:2410318-Pleurochrysis_carterae.AAC.1